MTYLVATAEEMLKGVREPFIKTLKSVEITTAKRAREVLEGLRYGGLFPKEGEYAKVTLRPEFFYGADGSQLVGSFRQNLTSTGWQTILSADLSPNGLLKEKWVMGIAGIAIQDAAIRVSQIKIEKGDRSFAVIDIEEISRGPVTILFKVLPSEEEITEAEEEREGRIEVEDLVFDYSANFNLRAYVTSTGYQTIKPIGVAFVSQRKAISETI